MDIKKSIQDLGLELGFEKIAIADCNLEAYHANFKQKTSGNWFGDMTYMNLNLDKRLNPAKLVSHTKSIITARMNYYPTTAKEPMAVLSHSDLAYVSRYALGRDYHKVFRKKLQNLALKIQDKIGVFGYRVFTDSAPVMELALAEKSGLGWLGKNSCILDRDNGSWFFLGEIYTDLNLAPDIPVKKHCGTCSACMDKCPTNAFIAPYILDPKKCISYLTIEHHGAIPIELRPLIGNRIYGCDDCQLVCPWTKFVKPSQQVDFKPRNDLDDISLLKLWKWTKQDFNKKLEGSAIRRIGYEKWQRNLAIAIGNGPANKKSIQALQNKKPVSPMVEEHIIWALNQLSNK